MSRTGETGPAGIALIETWAFTVSLLEMERCLGSRDRQSGSLFMHVHLKTTSYSLTDLPGVVGFLHTPFIFLSFSSHTGNHAHEDL